MPLFLTLLFAFLFCVTAVAGELMGDFESIAATLAKKNSVLTHTSGLLYEILDHGEGSKHPTGDAICTWSFGAKLFNGTRVHNPTPGKPNKHSISEVPIRAFGEMFPQMVEGDLYQLWIPPSLALPEAAAQHFPNIPPNTAMIVKVKLRSIEGATSPASEEKLGQRRAQITARAEALEEAQRHHDQHMNESAARRAAAPPEEPAAEEPAAEEPAAEEPAPKEPAADKMDDVDAELARVEAAAQEAAESKVRQEKEDEAAKAAESKALQDKEDAAAKKTAEAEALAKEAEADLVEAGA